VLGGQPGRPGLLRAGERHQCSDLLDGKGVVPVQDGHGGGGERGGQCGAGRRGAPRRVADHGRLFAPLPPGGQRLLAVLEKEGGRRGAQHPGGDDPQVTERPCGAVAVRFLGGLAEQAVGPVLGGQ